ncbi:MAG: nucleotidyl transferase AbiEii/AbiGii toxin family protein [Candidatus Eremiobacteraeota bacterium]|nr:nucleotidyl transferase AbiEii/AbiGii toxin family protein [Candidatus Eremiobacteraeota bacterium]
MANLPTHRELGRAIEADAARTDVGVRRHRRWIAVNALIEVFHIAQRRGIISRFAVKGGFALEFRFRAEARASRDVDIVVSVAAMPILDTVVDVLRLDWSGFTFEIKGTPELREHSYRLQIAAHYQRQDWSTFELEIVFGEITEHDMVPPLDLVAYGLLTPTGIPCMTIAEQVAQKLHALTDPAESRPRDLIDVYLCTTRLPPDNDELRDLCTRVFAERATHAWPPVVEMREGWQAQLAEMIDNAQLDLTVDQVLEGVRALVKRLAEG